MSELLDLLCDAFEDVNEDGGEKTKESSKETEETTADDQNPEKDKAQPSQNGEEDNEEVTSMEAKLKAMQEEMKKMQELLEKKKKKPSERESCDSTQTSKAREATKSLKTVDIFEKSLQNSKEESASSGCSSSRFLSSPVKSNPFEDPNKSRKTAKTFMQTPEFGPALPKKVTRVLTGDEKKNVLSKFDESRQIEAMIKTAKSDLADSSDEDEGEEPLSEKYNSFGKDIKRIAKKKEVQAPADLTGQITSIGSKRSKSIGFNDIRGTTINVTNSGANSILPSNTYVEKFSRIKIANANYNQNDMEGFMVEKAFAPICKMKESISGGCTKGNWATIGVVYNKTTLTTKAGKPYSLWRVTDLVGDIKTIVIFLFGKAHNSHYKMPLNRVVGILNAKVKEERSGEVTLSVDHQDKILEIGDSVDFGKCKMKRSDGTGCTNIVNLGICEYCTFHVRKAYNAMSSKRAELQSSFSSSVDTRSRIMNKIDPKGTYFAAGQQVNESATTKKLLPGDVKKLARLGVNPVTKIFEAEEKQKSKLAIFDSNGGVKFKSHLNDVEKNAVVGVAKNVSVDLGLKLLHPTPGARGLIKTLTKSEQHKLEALEKNEPKSRVNNASASQLLQNHKNRLAEERAHKVLTQRQEKVVPKLGRGLKEDGFIDIAVPPEDPKKLKALQALKGKPIEKRDPNYVPVKKRKAEEISRNKKKIALSLESSQNEEKPPKDKSPVRKASTGEVLTKERLEKIRNARSRHEDLVDDYEREVHDKKMDEMEKREAMEEKMINTKEIETKAVTCASCNYTSFSQSQLCRDLGHKIRVIKAKKRFFECKGCKRRTISLDRYPDKSCSNCGSASWERTGMMKEKSGPKLESEQLLIRGVEQKFVNQAAKSSDLSLDSIMT